MAMAFIAMVFTSCGDTEMCYKITIKGTILSQEYTATHYERTTKNNIKEVEERLKAGAVLLGVDEKTIKISSVAVPDTNCQ